jgi:histidyl-tRNA synthetase
MKKGRFREFYQCDFDIAGEYAPMFPDAEVLSVLVQILSSLDLGNFVVKVNHRKFLDAMIEMAGCEKRKFKSICSSIDKLDKEPWEKVRQELINQKGLTEQMADNLHKFVQFQGKPWELLKQLQDEKVFDAHESGKQTVAEMQLLF